MPRYGKNITPEDLYDRNITSGDLRTLERAAELVRTDLRLREALAVGVESLLRSPLATKYDISREKAEGIVWGELYAILRIAEKKGGVISVDGVEVTRFRGSKTD